MTEKKEDILETDLLGDVPVEDVDPPTPKDVTGKKKDEPETEEENVSNTSEVTEGSDENILGEADKREKEKLFNFSTVLVMMILILILPMKLQKVF